MNCAPRPRVHRAVRRVVLTRRAFVGGGVAVGCGGGLAIATKLTAGWALRSPAPATSPALSPGSQWPGTPWAGGLASAGPAQPPAVWLPTAPPGADAPISMPEPSSLAVLAAGWIIAAMGRRA